MRMLRPPVAFLSLVTLLAVMQPTTAEGPRQSARLVTFDALQGRLNDPGLRLLDARPRAEYDKGHIPGAVWLDTKAAGTLAARPGGLTDADAWGSWLAPLGIGPGIEVLVCDGDRQLEAARLWWLLGYLGVEHVGLIDGNVPLWVKQGRPTTTTATAVEPRTVGVNFRNQRHATRDDVLEALRMGKTQVIDARSVGEHTGEKVMSKRGGRIPSACHLEWLELVDTNGRFLDEAAMRSRLDGLGIRLETPVITHCQGGGRASVDAFVFERLGFPTRNYYLGWSDWGNADETPVESGKPGAKKP